MFDETALKEIIKSNKITDKSINEQYQKRSICLMKKAEFTIAKPPANYIKRNRLFKKLDAELSKKVISVCANAGYGKTVLIDSWLSNRDKIKKVWYSIGSEDNDSQRFWGHLVITIMNELNIYDNNYNNSTQKLLSYPCKFLISIIINEASMLSENIIVILDNFHKINNQKIIEEFQYMFTHLPDNLHLIILSRYLPITFLDKLRLTDSLFELNDKDLILSKNEIHEYFYIAKEIKLSHQEVEIIYNITEGWMSAIEFIALSIKKSKDNKNFINNIIKAYTYIMEYLFQEVFSTQEKSIQDFLLKSSIFDLLNVNLCDSVLNRFDSHVMFKTLENLNLFITDLDNQEYNYKYHKLFCIFLRNELRSVYPGLENDLCLKASKWHEKNGYFIDAIKYSTRSKNYDNAIRILEESYNALLYELNTTKNKEDNKTMNLSLSNRELEVLKLISYGYSNKEISEKLYIAECTVKRHVGNILSKLNVKNRTHAIVLAKKLEIL